MRYWLLTSEFPPQFGGGISTYAAEHARIFSQHQHEVVVITHHYQNATTQFMNGYKVVYLDARQSAAFHYLGEEAALSCLYAQQVLSLIHELGAPDFIETQEYLGIGYHLLLLKRNLDPLLASIPILTTAHAPSYLYLSFNHVPIHRFPEFWIGEMERFSLLAADLVLFPSKYLFHALATELPELQHSNWHHLFNPFQAIPEPTPLESIEPEHSPSKEEEFEESIDLVCFGKMSLSKGSITLLEAMKLRWLQGSSETLTWVGGTDIFLHTEQMTIGDFVHRKFSQFIQEKKLILLGNIPPKKLNKYLQKAKAVVIPSLVDNLPYTVVESMSTRCVLVASSSGGQSELIEHGVSGFIFDWKNVNSFNHCIDHVLSLSEEKRKEIGKAAQQRILQCCNPEAYYQQKLKLLQSVQQKRQPRNHYPIIRPQEKNLKFDTFTGLTLSTPDDRGMLTPTTISSPNTSKKSKPFVSIVIPYYNMGAYLQDTLNCLLRMEKVDLDIILVNDGSTEKESIKKLEEISAKYPQIRQINQRNGGLAAARNTGLQLASAPLVLFLDADDLIEEKYLIEGAQILHHYPNLSFVGCWVQYFEGSTGKWAAHLPELPYLLYHNTMNSGILLKTEAVKTINGYDSDMIYGMEDYEFVVRMVANGFHGTVIPKFFYHYRIRKNSMARSFTTEKQLFLYRLIAEKNPSVFKNYALELQHLLQANGPGYLTDNPTKKTNVLFGGGSISNAISLSIKSLLKDKLKQKIKRYPRLKNITLKVYRIFKP